jgi:hypothetical protein
VVHLLVTADAVQAVALAASFLFLIAFVVTELLADLDAQPTTVATLLVQTLAAQAVVVEKLSTQLLKLNLVAAVVAGK